MSAIEGNKQTPELIFCSGCGSCSFTIDVLPHKDFRYNEYRTANGDVLYNGFPFWFLRLIPYNYCQFSNHHSRLEDAKSLLEYLCDHLKEYHDMSEEALNDLYPSTMYMPANYQDVVFDVGETFMKEWEKKKDLYLYNYD